MFLHFQSHSTSSMAQDSNFVYAMACQAQQLCPSGHVNRRGFNLRKHRHQHLHGMFGIRIMLQIDAQSIQHMCHDRIGGRNDLVFHFHDTKTSCRI